jgi:hypothetical protein
MQTLKFQFQRIKIDFITITMPILNNEQKLRNIANYFHSSFGFNCFLSIGNNIKIVQTLFQDCSTKGTLIIRKNY